VSKSKMIAVLILAPLLWAGGLRTTRAKRGRIPVLVQATYNTIGDVEGPKVAPQLSDYVTFVSDGDVLGPGSSPGRREVYLFNVATRGLLRVTDSGTGESFEATRIADEGKPGRWMAFVSTGDLDLLQGDNSDGNAEIFAWSLLSGEFIQITYTGVGVESRRPWISDQAKCIAFDSNGDLDDNDGTQRDDNPGAGNENLDGSREAFFFEVIRDDLREGVTTQVSNGPMGTTSSNVVTGGYVFSRQCRSTAFQSDHDQLSIGASGNQIYVYTKTAGALELVSEPGTVGNNINPSISGASRFARGPFVVFQSDGDLMGNSSSGFEIFRARLFHPRNRQRTYFGTGNAETPVVSDGGGFIAFESDTQSIFSKKGEQLNADGNREIFRLKGARRVEQITSSSGCTNSQVSVNDDGRALAFRSTCDLIPGNNPSGVPQIFFYREVQPDDPILKDCQISAGCCNEENGCFTKTRGKNPKVQR